MHNGPSSALFSSCLQRRLARSPDAINLLAVCTLLIRDALVLSATYLAVSFHDSQLIIGLVTLGVAAFAYLGALVVCAAIRGIFFEDYVIRAFQNLRHASDSARSQRDLECSSQSTRQLLQTRRRGPPPQPSRPARCLGSLRLILHSGRRRDRL